MRLSARLRNTSGTKHQELWQHMRRALLFHGLSVNVDHTPLSKGKVMLVPFSLD